MCLRVFLVCLLAWLSPTMASQQEGRILFFAPYISKSIMIKALPVIEGLADRGHEVVLMMPFCEKCGKHENITMVHVKEYDDDFSDEMRKALVDPNLTRIGYAKYFLIILDGLVSVIDNAIGHPDLKTQIDMGFDSVIIMNTVGIPEIMASYLAEKTDAALIYYSTAQGPGSRISNFVGQPFHPAYMVQTGIVNFENMSSFSDRLLNTLVTIFNEAISKYYLATQERLLDERFPGEVRTPLDQLVKEVNAVLYTGHPLIDGVRPIVPNFQHIGLIHCRPGKPLSAEFAKFMDKSKKNGVILVSFGTFAGGDGIPESVRLLMVDAFSKLEQNIIWKWDGSEMKDLPPNVMLTEWVPQQDVLAHPALKVFISHVGQSSVQESLYHGVPVVAIPLAFDQPFYGDRIEALGAGKSLRYTELTSEQLYDATTEVLENPIYTENARRYSKILQDDITSPVEKAIWKVEYAMRHKENHYRSPVHDLKWYQYYLLDVIFFILSVIILVLIITCLSCRKLCKLISSSGTKHGGGKKEKIK